MEVGLSDFLLKFQANVAVLFRRQVVVVSWLSMPPEEGEGVGDITPTRLHPPVVPLAPGERGRAGWVSMKG